MSYPHIYAVRIVAGLSLVSALVLIFLSSYVFISRLEDLEASKFPGHDVPRNISKLHGDDNKVNLHYQALLTKIDKLWTKYRSILVSGGALAIVSGLLQAIFSGLTLFGDSKVIRLYIRKWVTVHFILLVVLFIILLNTILLSENKKDNEKWDKLVEDLKYHLTKERPYNDYSGLYRFLAVGKQLMYIGVGVDLAVILILMGAMFYLLRNYSDPGYEQYE